MRAWDGGAHLNKQRYLAELRRLLVFMTEEDVEETIRRYTEMFDAAGEDGETGLVEQLGSPTKAAIGLSRGYEPGKLNIPTPVVKPRPGTAAAVLDLPTEKPVSPWEDLPDFRLPGMSDEDEEAEDKAAPEPPPAAEVPEPDLPRRIAPAKEAPVPVTKLVRTMPLGLGIPLFLIVMLGLGVPAAAVFLALMAAALVPGGAILFAVYLIVVGGLWCMGYIADALLLFGLAFVVLAAGIVVLWFGIWVWVKLITVYAKGVRWLAGELLGRKVTVNE